MKQNYIYTVVNPTKITSVYFTILSIVSFATNFLLVV